jgi:hypothetical protein
MQEVPDTVAGGRKQPLQAMGLNAPVAPGRVFDTLRADADWLADAATPEQRLAIQGHDPRTPPATEWSDTPEARAERDKKTAEWLSSRR